MRPYAPLTVLHIVRAPIGGIFRHVVDLAVAQAQIGHRVGIVCDSLTGSKFEADLIDRVRPQLAHGITRRPMPRSVGLADFMSLIGVAKEIRRRKPDVIHTHGSKGGLYGRLVGASFRHRPLTFYAPHGGSLHFDTSTLQGRLYFAVEGFLERWTDALLHVCEFEKHAYEQKVGEPKCSAYVVHNGLRPDELQALPRHTPRFDFLYLGVLRDLKGVDILLQSIAKLRGNGYDFNLALVGDGREEEKRRYQELADGLGVSGVVHQLGPMPARDAFMLSRFLVLPSRAESFPYVALEAIAAGLPVIATDVGGLSEVFGQDHRLVPPGDPDALADRLACAMDCPLEEQRAMAPVQQRLKTEFTIQRMVSAVEDIYVGHAKRRL